MPSGSGARSAARHGGARGRLARLTGLASLLLGCSTLAPLETASTVPAGAWRFEPQVALPAWCTLSADPNGCHLDYISRPVFPQLRLGLRRGLAEGWEVGGSVHTVFGTENEVDPGLAVQVKKELWSRPNAAGGRHVLSTALTLDDTQLATHNELSFIVPLLYGYRTGSVEWVLGAGLRERLALGYQPAGTVAATEHFNLSAGLVHRSGFGLQLGYEAPFRYADAGSFVVSLGVLFELGGGTP